MAIALDASSPAAVSQTAGATTTLATGSFSPVGSSLLLISWQGNSQAGNPTAPSIANTGSLSFTQTNYRSSADAGGASGQAAIWYSVINSAPGSMTVTVTNNATSGNRHARLKGIVLTGVDLASPIVANNEGTDGLGGLDNVTYTSGAANSMGFASVSDWDVSSTTFTAAAGTTIVDSASVASSVNCATLRQTTVAGSGTSVSLGLTAPTSTSWNWCWVEVREGSAAASLSPPITQIATGALVRSHYW